MLFNIYMRPLAQLVRSFGLGCHQYADDTQLFLLMDGHPTAPPDCLASCLEAVVDWLKRSRLKLNPAKTEVLWLGRRAERQLWELPTLDGTQLTPVPSVKSLGVILDSGLSMEGPGNKRRTCGLFPSTPSAAARALPLGTRPGHSDPCDGHL